MVLSLSQYKLKKEKTVEIVTIYSPLFEDQVCVASPQQELTRQSLYKIGQLDNITKPTRDAQTN